jgi:hypothetical protein
MINISCQYFIPSRHSHKMVLVELDAFPVSGKAVKIKVSLKDVEETFDFLKQFEMSELQNAYSAVCRNMVEVDMPRLFERIQNGSEDAKKTWANFCDDVVIGHCLKWKLERCK